jgi:hypothetical protein
VSKWSFSDESKPLLKGTRNEIPYYNSIRTPSDDDDLEEDPSRQQLPTSCQVDNLADQTKGKENSRSQHVIQCHTLLQPVQPLNLGSTAAADCAPPPLPAFFDAPGSTPVPLQSKRKSLPKPITAPVSIQVFATKELPTEPSTTPPDSPNTNPRRVRALLETPLSPSLASKQVHVGMPSGYWAGRFCSLNDQFMNQVFDGESTPPELSICSFISDSASVSSRRTDGMKRPIAPPGSLEQALQHLQTLESMCTTEQARRSLFLFRNMYANNHDMPQLRVEIQKESPVAIFKTQSGDGTRKVSESSTASNGRGQSRFAFMNRLRGRKSRMSSGKG